MHTGTVVLMFAIDVTIGDLHAIVIKCSNPAIFVAFVIENNRFYAIQLSLEFDVF